METSAVPLSDYDRLKVRLNESETAFRGAMIMIARVMAERDEAVQSSATTIANLRSRVAALEQANIQQQKLKEECDNKIFSLNTQASLTCRSMLEIARGNCVCEYDLEMWGSDLIEAVQRWIKPGQIISQDDCREFGGDLIELVARVAADPPKITDEDREAFGDDLVTSIQRWTLRTPKPSPAAEDSPRC